MLKKFALLIAVLVASAGFFLAGLYAPDAVRDFLDSGSEEAAAPALQEEPEEDGNGEAAVDDAGTDAAEEEPALVDFDALQATFMAPDGSQWGVLVRKYASEPPAAALVEDLAELGTKSVTFRVEDANDKTWFIVVAGPYEDAAEAEDRRIRLTSSLGIDFRPSVVIFPAKPPAAEPPGD